MPRAQSTFEITC